MMTIGLHLLSRDAGRRARRTLCGACLVATGAVQAQSDRTLACAPTTTQVSEQCNAALAATTPVGETPLTILRLGLDTLPSTLEAVAPYCGEIVLWYLVGTLIDANEYQRSLKWYELARTRSLLRRLARPREFIDSGSRTIKTLEAVFADILEDVIRMEPQAEYLAVRQALDWDREYPSSEYPPNCYPGLYAEIRSRLQRKATTLNASLAP